MAVNWANVAAIACLAIFLFGCARLYTTRRSASSKPKSTRTIYAGNFVINHTDPTTDLVRIELDVDLVDVERSDVIMFKVVTDAKSPQD